MVPAMHAVDRLVRAHIPMQRLQHQSVAPERYPRHRHRRHRDCHTSRSVAPAPLALPCRRSRQRRCGHIVWALSSAASHLKIVVGITGLILTRKRVRVVYRRGRPLSRRTRARRACANGRAVAILCRNGGRAGRTARNRESTMRVSVASGFIAVPHRGRLMLALLAFFLVAGAHAQDATQPALSATPSGQKSGASGPRGGKHGEFAGFHPRTTPSAAGFDHQTHRRPSRPPAGLYRYSGFGSTV